MLTFSKMHGIGNDYIYINCFKETVTDPEKLSVFLSDVRFGVGSDGLVLILPSEVADFRMRIFNADGSEAMMCGNATRCIGKYVYDMGMTDKTEISLETNSGIKYLTLYPDANNKIESVKVDMGKAILVPREIPVNSDLERFIAQPVTVDGKEYAMTCVSMGNPHAVMFIDEHTKDFDLEKYGKACEGNTNVFPDRVNAEFAKIIDRNNIEMRVYERGSGETLACGTGSCATAVAAITLGLCDNDVTIHLLGGDLDISWSGDVNDSVFMTGPAKEVFTGEVDLNKFD